MVTIRRTTTTCLAILALILGAACASSPDIPEEEGDSEKQSYRSAQEDDERSSEQTEDGEATQAQTTGDLNARQQQPQRGNPGAAQRGGQSGEQPSEPPRASGKVATVDGEEIPASAFNDEIDKISKTGKFPPALLHRFKGRLIDRLVDQQLIDNAIDNSSVEVSDEEVEEKLDTVRSEFDEAKNKQSSEGKKGKQQPQSLEQLAGEYGISSDELRNSIRRSIAIEKLLLDQGVEMPTDEDVRQFYEDNPDKFEEPAKVKVRHILLKVQPGADETKWQKVKKKIDKIHEKVSKPGADFAKVAKKKSDGPSAKNGGDIGFIGKEQFDEQFTDVAFELEKGEVSDPVKTRYGWHVIKLVDRRDARTLPFEEIEPQLAEKLKNQRIQQKLKSYLKELRRDAEIEKHPDNVE